MDPKARFRAGPKAAATGGISDGALPGPSSLPSVAEITAVNATTFSCRRLDETGTPTGDEFTVRVFSLPVVGGLIGQQELANCDPKRVVGDLLRIEYRNQYIGNGQHQEGWWAVPEFTAFECEVSDCTEIP